MIEEGVFPHECIEEGCSQVVQYDDEPWCFTHSPDDGSSVPGYSARQEATRQQMVQKNYAHNLLESQGRVNENVPHGEPIITHNIFDREE
jgi:hypothetical protein